MRATAGEHRRRTPARWFSIERRYPRIKISGLICDIADGNLVFGGIVTDVSAGGFKVSNLPRTMSSGKHNFSAVLSGNNRHYRLVVVPCWSKTAAEGYCVEIGFRIIQAPWEWTDFISNAVYYDAVPVGLQA
jgi:hypothetical protein